MAELTAAKPAWASKSVWGSVVLLASMALDQSGIITLDEAAQQQIVDAVLDVIQACSGVFALWGRLVAKTRIGKAKPVEPAPPAEPT